jgi:UDPglucose--hexose-1-phosphate uridylyltransferase
VTEFRTDPITGRTVIVVPSRAIRPNEHSAVPAPVPSPSDCPFCEGNEASTPPEVASIGPAGRRPNSPGWDVRTIPNKFPTVVASEPGMSPSTPGTAFETVRAFGFHEVVIESPTHTPLFPFLPTDQVLRVLRMSRERVRDLLARPGVGSATLFENSGPESGGSLWHPHCQIVATPGLTPSLQEETRGAERYRQRTGRDCPFEDVYQTEAREGVRVLFESDDLVAFAPFASAYPFEARILPVRHSPSFGQANDKELEALSERLPRLLRALLTVVPDASYNFVVRSPAPSVPGSDQYHWHLDIYPRVVRPDGFDLGSEYPVNSVAPEQAAETLRAAWGAKR